MFCSGKHRLIAKDIVNCPALDPRSIELLYGIETALNAEHTGDNVQLRKQIKLQL